MLNKNNFKTQEAIDLYDCGNRAVIDAVNNGEKGLWRSEAYSKAFKCKEAAISAAVKGQTKIKIPRGIYLTPAKTKKLNMAVAYFTAAIKAG